jgi:hypothetical protein
MGLLGGVVNSVPIVGHIKGIVHYACGDTERGDAAVWSATRTTVVLGAGVAGAFAGPAGAVAAAAAAGAGMYYIRTSITGMYIHLDSNVTSCNCIINCNRKSKFQKETCSNRDAGNLG